MDPSSPWTDLARPPLRAGALRAALTDGEPPPWRRLEVVAETGSTNADVVARACAGEPEGLVLAADHQLAGRGRLARTWTAPPRASIAVSVLLRPTGVPEHRLAWLPLLTGLAVVDALSGRCGLAATLKWPNDVLVPVDGVPRKVCGVLAELVPESAPEGRAAVVVGVGLNVSQSAAELPQPPETAQPPDTAHPPEAALPRATSLLLAGSATTDRDTVLRAYLRALAVRYRAWLDAAGDPRESGVGPAYREACATLGQLVEVHLPSREGLVGIAEEVDDGGRLVVRTSDGELNALAAGDIVHLRSPQRP